MYTAQHHATPDWAKQQKTENERKREQVILQAPAERSRTRYRASAVRPRKLLSRLLTRRRQPRHSFTTALSSEAGTEEAAPKPSQDQRPLVEHNGRSSMTFKDMVSRADGKESGLGEIRGNGRGPLEDHPLVRFELNSISQRFWSRFRKKSLGAGWKYAMPFQFNAYLMR